MPCGPITQGASGGSLPESVFSGTAAEITDIVASIPPCLAVSLDANSDLNTWLQVLGASICANVDTIETKSDALDAVTIDLGSLTTVVGGNTTTIGNNTVVVEGVTIRVDALETDVGDNTTAIGDNTTAVAGVTIRVDALELPGGIADGTAGGELPYWDGSLWAGIPAAMMEYDSAGGGGIFLMAPSGADASLSVRGSASYNNIFEIQNTAGTSQAFEVPESTAVIGTNSRDFIIQEGGTAVKGFVVKDRTSGAYKRVYVDNNAIAIEAY